MKTVKLLTTLALVLAMALVLVACGGSAGGSSSSSASSGGSASSSASSGSSSMSSSSSAPENSTGQGPSESYMLVKLDVQRNDGSSMTSSYTYDDRGRSLAGGWKLSGSDSTYDIAFTVTDWDEYGHEMKSEEANDYGDGKPFTIETETSNPKYNADGSIVSVNQVNKINKESFEEGEVASTKVTRTWEYGTNVEVLRKLETKAEHFDKSGALMITETQTNEFGEDGLQTRCIIKSVGAEGTEINQTVDITWTKDANGKPVSYSMVLSQDGADALTNTGDVKTNESGLISWIGNIKVDGEAYSTSVAIDYLKIDDPLPNAYEGWKSFTLTDAVLSRDFGDR